VFCLIIGKAVRSCIPYILVY